MLFKNTTDRELSFRLGGYTLKVDPLGTIELPDRYAYVPRARGIPLVAVTLPEIQAAHQLALEERLQAAAVYAAALAAELDETIHPETPAEPSPQAAQVMADYELTGSPSAEAMALIPALADPRAQGKPVPKKAKAPAKAKQRPKQ